MRQSELESFRQSLIALKGDIEQLNIDSKEAADTVALDQSKVGRLSRMDALQAQQMAKETTRRRQVHLQKIDSALRRLDAGDYGNCLKCDEEINKARLAIDPATTRCMACMES